MERFISFEGCLNFRDMGGYSTYDGRIVRWQRIYRSDSLHWMTPDDATRARAELDITLVLDLRSLEEVRQFGKGLLVGPGVGYHHFPLLETVNFGEQDILSPDLSDMDGFYVGMLEQSASLIAAALTILSREAAYPAVFHCAAGKDRTGVLAAVLLAILGVKDEQIIQDYLLTNHRINDIIERLLTVSVYNEAMENLPPELITAPREWIEHLLAWVRSEYGSMRAYVEAQDVSEEVFHGLERNFLMK